MVQPLRTRRASSKRNALLALLALLVVALFLVCIVNVQQMATQRLSETWRDGGGAVLMLLIWVV